MEILVKTLAGLEDVLARELESLGAEAIRPVVRAVACTGDLTLLYRINLESRTALRVLRPLHQFRAQNEDQLYRGVGEVDWSAWLGLSNTLAVDGVVHSDHFNHSQYVALKTKDAIVDQFRNRTGRRPSIDTDAPDLRVNVHIRADQVSLSLDSSGDSLHKRGYRHLSVEAPVNEVLAAGMILLTNWDGLQPFVDPMCGSGTIPIEAARIARRIPPRRNQDTFGFMQWPDFDPPRWKQIRREAEERVLPECPAPIYAYDKDMQAIRATRYNAGKAGVGDDLHIQRRPFERLQPPQPHGLLMMNPPYDERLPVPQIEAFYGQIGDRLKQFFAGYEAWILSSHMEALKNIGLRATSTYPLYNGSLPCKLVEFELYEGSRKEKITTE